MACEGCWCEGPLRFVEATTKTVRIVNSRMPAMNCARMRTEGILNLSGSVIEGVLRLDQAHVAGEVTLMGAHVGDGTGEAVAAKGITVDGDMQCNRGFAAHGSINLRAARITGRLSIHGAVLNAPESDRQDRSALHLSLLRAAELDLRAAGPIVGGIRLSNAHVGTLDDDPTVWPRRIWLHGFTYDSIQTRRSSRVPVQERLEWLRRDSLGFRPQPYEELAAFYRHTLDLLIPIGAFGLRNSFASTGAAQWLADALIAAGWILATAVIAGITRAVRRD